MPDCGCEVEIKNKDERKVLWLLLAINAVMFFVEFAFGWFADSTGLIADSLDMLADATVYAIALYAVGRSLQRKAHAALASGIFQIILAIAVICEVIRRFISGSEPLSELMISVACIALIANIACLLLIAKHRNGEVHMRASWIFSKNDVLANIGVIIAGTLVHITGASYPDLVIGIIISIIVLRGGISIVRDARSTHKQELDT
jgi:cation diffusion facilitator family transporter